MQGMVTLTLVPWIPNLHPPPCPTKKSCKGPTSSQMGFLALALGFLSLGSAGIRPCSIPFGVDQFDPNTEEGRKGINSFFNWYYTTFTVVIILALTVTVYIQTNVSWVVGFGIPTLLMVVAIILFFLGTRVYVYVKPEGSIFSGIIQGLVAAYKKRNVKLPENGEFDGIYYDPPLMKGTIVKKLSLTHKFRFLNKAAVIQEGELRPDGSRTNKWNLSSIQQIEEVKLILRIMPVWASGIICFLAMAQQGTFTVSQALKMDRHLGPHFEIPAGSLGVISMITIGIWLPIYDRVIVPSLRRVTKIEGGITLLQRIGIGLVFSILSMVAAGLIEPMRRASANKHGGSTGVAPLSVLWLSPQLILMGFAEAFNIIGQIEFYNKEFPENMTSLANSLFSITAAGANYLSVFLVNVIHHTTGTKDHPDWLTKDINQGRVEYFYFLIAGLGVLNFGYFLYVAPGYKYKSRVRVDEDVDGDHEMKPDFSIELNGLKP
ncbi:OLC1v1028067C1 [Oldenlandia corymbosa var. corymbosa]|uniref:OLC1v1028067C1 n=1 Tax=Oldenlandia corymbosa var. corymbosa TaxID=529605 RepID=A0AAV1CD66_OLDCO|nr:OLC1v1028067C1 [Oldenlandia corymbosa var. corymbosa]